MTQNDVMMDLILASAEHLEVKVLILAGGATIFGTPISLDEFIDGFGNLNEGLRKALDVSERSPGTSVFLRDVQVRGGGDMLVNSNVLAISRDSIDAVTMGAFT